MKANHNATPTAAVRARMDDVLKVVASFGEPIGVRSVCYRMVAKGFGPKTELFFERVSGDLTRLRMNGELPFGAIVDLGSSPHGGDFGPDSFDPKDQVKHYLEKLSGFKTSLWQDQETTVQVWLEKDGMAAAVQPVCDEYRVPLLSGGGQPSISLQRQGFELLDTSKDNVVLTLYDLDPGGVHMPRDTQDKYEYWMSKEGWRSDIEVDFVPVAITSKQVAEWHLPTRPTHGKRTLGFVGDSVELDAADPFLLRLALKKAIETNLDIDDWNASLAREEELNDQVTDIVADLVKELER